MPRRFLDLVARKIPLAPHLQRGGLSPGVLLPGQKIQRSDLRRRLASSGLAARLIVAEQIGRLRFLGNRPARHTNSHQGQEACNRCFANHFKCQFHCPMRAGFLRQPTTQCMAAQMVRMAQIVQHRMDGQNRLGLGIQENHLHQILATITAAGMLKSVEP